MKTIHKVIIGDSRNMSEIPDKSVQLVVTSPPYWQLKDYGAENQIGFHESYQDYINNLNRVWMECDRVLSDGCKMCINIGDQFARSVYYGRYKVIPIRTEIIRFCEHLGLDYMGAIIWQKTTTTNTTGGGAIMGSYPYPRNGILKIDYEFILIFKKQGKPPRPTPRQKEESILADEEWKTFFSSHWYVPGVQQQNHLAMFPIDIPLRLIRMYSFVGETVLDPFLGSGTSSLAAKLSNRHSIGYEINPDFLSIIKEKIDDKQPTLQGNIFSFINQAPFKLESLKELPYQFKDPHKLDKKVDIKKNTYGSIIDNQSKEEEYYRVNEIIDPETLVLSNGKTIKLIGIKTKAEFKNDALLFLNNLTEKKKVFLKFDPKMAHKDGPIPCYLYLQNKTFVNRHLIRSGYVEVDQSQDYVWRERFLGSIK
ncbi:MAG: site-specific DNA-methyltransferase [Chloroflexi bacterium]|jgi:site-specific DNA-methyltransferase (adenine-specific)|nr:site-specific DNA-methyltransferase [Chloroflexota bacterium]